MIGKEPNEPQQMPMLPMPEDAPQRVQSSDHPESKHKRGRAADRPPEKKPSTVVEETPVRLVETPQSRGFGESGSDVALPAPGGSVPG